MFLPHLWLLFQLLEHLKDYNGTSVTVAAKAFAGCVIVTGTEF
jgi:hypothetical protein